MGKIFISYRRDGLGESSDMALLIKQRLMAHFGEARIIMDVSHVKMGDNWQPQIKAALRETELLVAVIGPQWLDSVRERERSRKDVDNDPMRFEVETALGSPGVKVVPVYTKGMRPFREDELPESLQVLASKDGLQINQGKNTESDLELLVRELRRTLSGDAKPVAENFTTEDASRRRGRKALLALGLLWLALVAWREWLPPAAVDKAALGHLLHDNFWVTYDPSGKYLRGSAPVYPPPEEMKTDLLRIKEAGFSGILTTSSDKEMMVVPSLAKEVGLRVIMGVWNPADHRELERAVHRAAYVDAYCIGDGQALQGFPVETLESAVRYVKKRTGLPAAVSDLSSRYDARRAAIGDWLFPDAHLTLRDLPQSEPRADLDRDVSLFMKSTQAMAEHARTLDRPLVFKNVAYPHAGVANASPEMQKEFYARILDSLSDAQRGHVTRTSIVVQGAFDTPWKNGKPFEKWDPYTGLLELDAGGHHAKATPAVAELLRHFPGLSQKDHPSGAAQ
jgi:hypothetical protein